MDIFLETIISLEEGLALERHQYVVIFTDKNV